MNYTFGMLSLFPFEIISKPGEFGIGNALIVSLTGILVVLSELAILALCITVIGKVIGKITKKKPVTQDVAEINSEEPSSVSTIGDRRVKLIDVDEKTAAMVMALVSHETDIPLDRLDFKSIKKVD